MYLSCVPCVNRRRSIFCGISRIFGNSKLWKSWYTFELRTDTIFYGWIFMLTLHLSQLIASLRHWVFHVEFYAVRGKSVFAHFNDFPKHISPRKRNIAFYNGKYSTVTLTNSIAYVSVLSKCCVSSLLIKIVDFQVHNLALNHTQDSVNWSRKKLLKFSRGDRAKIIHTLWGWRRYFISV